MLDASFSAFDPKRAFQPHPRCDLLQFKLDDFDRTIAYVSNRTSHSCVLPLILADLQHHVLLAACLDLQQFATLNDDAQAWSCLSNTTD